MFSLIESYVEKGIPAIPVKGKMPIVKAWSDYCDRLPTKEDILYWEKTTNPTGIGICLGPISNICAIDCDTDNPDVKKLLQYSPVEKIGVKGFTRFFRLRDLDDPNSTSPTGIISLKDEHGNMMVEFFFSGKQTVIPPSLHPDAGVYKWKTNRTLLDIDPIELPVFDPENITAVRNHLNKSNPMNLPKIPVQSADTEGHRFNDMMTFTSDLIRKGTSLDDAVDSLIAHDQERNGLNPFFLDSSKGFKTLSARVNAGAFYGKMLESLNSKKTSVADIEEPKSLNDATYAGEFGELIKIDINPVPFDLKLIPKKMAEWAVLNSQNSGIEYPVLVMQCLTGISSLLGNKIAIYPKKYGNYSQPVNLWFTLVARASSKKTSTSAIALKGLIELGKHIKKKEKEEKKKVEARNNAIEFEISENEKRLKGAMKDDQPEAVLKTIRDKIEFLELQLLEDYVPYQANIQNATPERLMKIAEGNRTGGLVFHNEGLGLFQQFNKKGYEVFKAFLNNAWDGDQPFSYQTKSQGDIYVEKLCLSLIINIQTSVFKKYGVGEMEESSDGFVQRSLYIYQNPERKEVLDVPMDDSLDKAITDLYFQAYNLENNVKVTLNDEAYERYMKFLNWVEKETFEQSPLIPFISKYRGLVLRIAYVLQFIESSHVPTKISLKWLENAISLLEYNTENIKRLIHQSEGEEAMRIIENFKTKTISNGISFRDLVRAGIFPRSSENVEKLKKYIDLLESHNYIRKEKTLKSVKIFINPKAFH